MFFLTSVSGTEKCAQSMLLVAMHSSHLENWECFSSITWLLTRVMMGIIYRRSVRHFSASSSDLRPVVTGSCQFISTSCGHTHPVSECASETTTTIITGSVLTGEEPPPHSGELKHALPQAGGPTQSQLSRPMCQDTTSPWSTDYGGNR